MERTRNAKTLGTARSIIAALSAILLVAIAPQPVSAAPPDKQPLYDVATGQPVTGTFSMLDRGDGGIDSRIRTAAEPGHVLTIWYVIFNAPAMCKDVDPDTEQPVPGACDADDIFLDPAAGGAGGFNATQLEAARISVLYGGDGGVVDAGGRLALDGGLAEGDVPDDVQVVIGSAGAMLEMSPVSGLEDARTAEVHIVLQDHGPAHDDPEALAAQLTRFHGACNGGPCVDLQFAIHQ